MVSILPGKDCRLFENLAWDGALSSGNEETDSAETRVQRVGKIPPEVMKHADKLTLPALMREWRNLFFADGATPADAMSAGAFLWGLFFLGRLGDFFGYTGQTPGHIDFVFQPREGMNK